MKKLIRYLRHYKKEAVIGPLFKLLEASFELLIPLVMAGIVDRGIREGDTAYILAMGGLMVGLGFLGLVCSLTAQYFAAKAAVGFGSELRADMFAHINRLSYTELDEIGTSTLITRITSDINQAQAGVNLVLRLFLRSPFIVAGAVVMAFTINVRLAWIFVVLVPVLSAIIFFVMYFSIPIYRQVQNRLDKVLLATRENLAGARVIRAFSRQKAETAEFNAQSDALMKTQLLVGRISALMNPATYVVVNAAVILVLWQGGAKVDSGIITQGELMALINYMSQILLALVALANLIVTFTRASASAIRINEVFAKQPGMREGAGSARARESAGDAEPEERSITEKTKERNAAEKTQKSVIEEPKERNAAEEPGARIINKGTVRRNAAEETNEAEGSRDAVVFRHVYFAYQGHKDALEDINFSVKRGETLGIIGGTGSGKSSLVNLVSRFYDVRQGSVLVDGMDVRDYRFEDLRAGIGVVPQTAVLFAGTIRDNMRWGKPNATDDEIYRALEIAQAREFVEAKPEGLGTLVAQGGKNFSGGQRQRLTIARALVGNPRILIMDDSASALDYATDARLRRAISAGTRKMTVFLVSQRAATIRSADKILVLDDGGTAGFGTHEMLMETCEVYREICLSQLDEKELNAHG